MLIKPILGLRRSVQGSPPRSNQVSPLRSHQVSPPRSDRDRIILCARRPTKTRVEVSVEPTSSSLNEASLLYQTIGVQPLFLFLQEANMVFVGANGKKQRREEIEIYSTK